VLLLLPPPPQAAIASEAASAIAPINRMRNAFSTYRPPGRFPRALRRPMPAGSNSSTTSFTPVSGGESLCRGSRQARPSTGTASTTDRKDPTPANQEGGAGFGDRGDHSPSRNPTPRHRRADRLQHAITRACMLSVQLLHGR